MGRQCTGDTTSYRRDEFAEIERGDLHEKVGRGSESKIEQLGPIVGFR